MAASPPSAFDLSRLDTWHGLRPGMPRAEAMEIIKKSGFKISTKMDEPDWLRVEGDWGLELRFTAPDSSGAGECLLQISVENEEDYRWGDKDLLNEPLHSALQVLKSVAAGAGWRPEDAVSDPTATGVPSARSDAITDELLLGEGTLWLPDVGIGLVMADGVVSDVVWRNKEDVPRPLVTRVTDTQLELSQRPDLGEHLLTAWKQRNLPPTPPTRSRNSMEVGLAVLLVLALAFIGWKAWQEMMSWQKAINIPGRVLNIQTKPGRLAQKVYDVEYKDIVTGRSQVVQLERADFYVEPRTVGETVAVSYLGGDPPRVKGPSRAKDAAFLTYTPWVLGVVMVYFLARLVFYLRAPGGLKTKMIELLKP